MNVSPIPTGPAWAVAMGLVFAGLALLLKAGVPLIQAVRRNGKNGAQSAIGRLEDLANLKAHMDEIAKESLDHRERIMGNINDTRQGLSAPLSAMVLSLALVEKTLIEIRDRLPRR